MGNYSDSLFTGRNRAFYEARGRAAKPADLKGVRGGNCNRTACQKPGANYWHTGTRAWYCVECTREINRVNRADAMGLYGIPYLIACPQTISDAERQQWKAKGITIPAKL